MLTIYRYELKQNIKTLLIWTLSVGGMGLFCILLFTGMKDNISEMAESFASMGAFSDAFGMKQLSIATLKGFYATEVGTIHALGGSMFASILSTTMLSKEEDGHTGEFLFTLPLSRPVVVTSKWCAIMTQLLFFNLACTLFYALGITALGEELFPKEFVLYHLMQLLMQLEIAAICYAISAFFKKNKPGLGLGIVLILYAYDLIARISPKLSDYKMLSPFSFSNAADILSTSGIDRSGTALGIVLLL